MFKVEDETNLVEDISHINQNILHWTSYCDFSIIPNPVKSYILDLDV